MQSLQHSHLALGVHLAEAPTPRLRPEPPRQQPPPGRPQRTAARVLARFAVRLDADAARRAVA